MSTKNYSMTRLQPVIGSHYGCKNRLPHDLFGVFENKSVKVEQCRLCSRKLRFTKRYLGRHDNRAYLEAHARNFAQPHGRTKRLYMKIYHPEKCKIIL